MANITIIALSDFEKNLQEKNYEYKVTGTVREETYNLSIDLRDLQDRGKLTLIGIIMMLPGATRDTIALCESFIETVKEYVQNTNHSVSVQVDEGLYTFKTNTPESEYQQFREDLLDN